jgi:hypothetical protein
LKPGVTELGFELSPSNVNMREAVVEILLLVVSPLSGCNFFPLLDTTDSNGVEEVKGWNEGTIPLTPVAP